jgi:hypothetical protein
MPPITNVTMKPIDHRIGTVNRDTAAVHGEQPIENFDARYLVNFKGYVAFIAGVVAAAAIVCWRSLSRPACSRMPPPAHAVRARNVLPRMMRHERSMRRSAVQE